jgi:hypothetical protein
MKTGFRFITLVFTLTLFNSCAERFTARGEGRPAFYIHNSPDTRSAEKRWVAKPKQALQRDTLHGFLKKGALQVDVVPSHGEGDWSLDSNLSLGTPAFKSQETSRQKTSPKKEMGKQKAPKKVQQRTLLESIWNWKKNTKGDKNENRSEYQFLELPYWGDPIGDWILYLNVILALIPAGLLLIGSFGDLDFLYGLLVWLIPLGITLYQYFREEYIYEEGALFRFSFWLIAGSIFAQFITAPIAIIQMVINNSSAPPVWAGIIFGLLILGLLLHIISYIGKLLNYIFGDMHWALSLLYSLLFLLVLFIVILIILIIIFPPY